MTFEIAGEYNTATVYTSQSKEDAETEAIEQIQSMVDHAAFESGGNDDAGDIAIMPDFHWGAGYLVDLNSYGDLVTPEGAQDVYQLSGWTENVIDFIDNMENIDGMIREIESTEPDN